MSTSRLKSRIEEQVKGMYYSWERTKLVTGHHSSHVRLCSKAGVTFSFCLQLTAFSSCPRFTFQLLSGYSLLDGSQPLWALTLSSQPASLGLPLFNERYYHLSTTQGRNLGFILSSSTSCQSPNPVYSALRTSLHANLSIPTAPSLAQVPVTSDHSFRLITASCLHSTA